MSTAADDDELQIWRRCVEGVRNHEEVIFAFFCTEIIPITLRALVLLRSCIRKSLCSL